LKIDDPIYYNIEGLDESQSDAIKFIFNNKVAVIKGPPGTGKTYCGAVAVREIIKHLDK
jgi:superfamily II DNA or RNA helicase